jgi:hypothetical protein
MAGALSHPSALGVQDSTGVNPYLPGTGWDVLFTPDVISSNLPVIECYHIALDGPVGSSAAVLLDNFPWDYVNQGWSNGWDPSQPMLIGQGMTVAICWNVAFTAGPYNRTTNIRAQATLWLRQPAPPPQQILPGLAF